MGKREIVTRYWLDGARWGRELNIVEVQGYETATKFCLEEKASWRDTKLPNNGALRCDKDEVFATPEEAVIHWADFYRQRVDSLKMAVSRENDKMNKVLAFQRKTAKEPTDASD